jgi:hypothetical protein
MRPGLSAAALAFAFAFAFASAAGAATIEVKGAWIRATPPGAPTAAGYAVIVNHGVTSDRLTGARTRAAASVEMHSMSMGGGIMRMRSLTAIPIAGNGTLQLAPNGDHLMLIGLQGPLKAGAHVKVTLVFQRAGAIAADFAVK